MIGHVTNEGSFVFPRPNVYDAEVWREYEWENNGIRISFLHRKFSFGCVLSKKNCFI